MPPSTSTSGPGEPSPARSSTPGPDSQQAEEYRQLAKKIHANKGKGVVPAPISMDELEDMLMEYGIIKSEEQELAELQAREAAAAAKAAAAA